MSTLTEIEAAAEALSLEQQEELLVFLAARLRAQGSRTPDPRTFTTEQISSWVSQDEADLRRLREGQ
jgi:hypothetical protein